MPGLPERARGRGPDAARVHAPLRRFRGRAAGRRAARRARVPDGRARGRARGRRAAASTRGARSRRRRTSCRCRRPTPTPTAAGPSGIEVDGADRARLPDAERPARVLLVDAQGLGLARARAARLHPQPRPSAAASETGEVPLIPTFRLPVQIHTRSANAKWLDEIAHTNPLWIHPTHAARLGIATGDLVRVETRDRLLRREGVGHRRHPARRRGVQPPHGPLEARRAGPAPVDGRR